MGNVYVYKLCCCVTVITTFTSSSRTDILLPVTSPFPTCIPSSLYTFPSAIDGYIRISWGMNDLILCIGRIDILYTIKYYNWTRTSLLSVFLISPFSPRSQAATRKPHTTSQFTIVFPCFCALSPSLLLSPPICDSRSTAILLLH